MKELSIEEKAQAYDEAIKKLKVLHDDWAATQNRAAKEVEDLFPIFKESEDEKIIKEMKDFFSHIMLGQENFLREDYDWNAWIAWLEKQGKNTYNKELSELLHKVICRYINDPDIPYSDREKVSMKLLPYVELLEKQGEQKPVQEIEPAPIFKIGNILKRKGKDYTFRVDRIQGGYYHCDRNYGAFFPIEEQGNWELVEQKSIEWSEEDEKMLSDIIKDLVHPWNEYIPDRIEDEIKWLKNRLKSLRPQNRWKPTKRQLLELSCAISGYSFDAHILEELEKDLKKLMEE